MSTEPTLQSSLGLESVWDQDGTSDQPEVVTDQYHHPEVVRGAWKPQGATWPWVDPGRTAEDGPPKKRLLGMSVTVFWVVIGAAILLVLGIALGVGLGVGLQNRQQQTSGATVSTSSSITSSSTTTTTTTTKSTPSTTTSATTPFVTSGTSGIAANSCNSTTPESYFAPDGTDFTKYCYTDWPKGDAAADGQGTVEDLLALIVYTFEDCMQQCLDYNTGLPANSTQCRAVTYNSNLTSIVEIGQQGGDCFLKNTNGKNLAGSVTSACAVIAD